MKSLDPISSSYFTTKKKVIRLQSIAEKNQCEKLKNMYYNNEFNKNWSSMRIMWNTISEIIHKQKNNHISI